MTDGRVWSDELNESRKREVVDFEVDDEGSVVFHIGDLGAGESVELIVETDPESGEILSVRRVDPIPGDPPRPGYRFVRRFLLDLDRREET